MPVKPSAKSFLFQLHTGTLPAKPSLQEKGIFAPWAVNCTFLSQAGNILTHFSWIVQMLRFVGTFSSEHLRRNYRSHHAAHVTCLPAMKRMFLWTCSCSCVCIAYGNPVWISGMQIEMDGLLRIISLKVLPTSEMCSKSRKRNPAGCTYWTPLQL